MTSGAENKKNTEGKKETETTVESAKAVLTTDVAEKPIVEEETGRVTNGGMYIRQTTDNADINSLCKFNFIFYFIYKHKYEEEQTGDKSLDYEF